MDQKTQYERHRSYIEANGLDRLFKFLDNSHHEEDVFDNVDGKLDIPFPPKPETLVRLHKLVRARKCFTVLEFGVGYSTIVLADALHKNQADWNALPQTPRIRNRHMFQLFSVDADKDWIESVKERLPGQLLDRVHLHYSAAKIGVHNGRLCHYYENLPDIVPDFVYVDGPSPKDVKGSVRGLTFQCDERTVMSADLLLMESTFLPGLVILIDGRTNNARFLERHFVRDYEVKWDREGDVTSFELTEDRLGKYNVLGSDFLD